MSDFSDDEEFFESIRRHEQKNSTPSLANASVNVTTNTLALASQSDAFNLNILPEAVKQRLYQADGEIAILKSQIDQLKSQSHEERLKLVNSMDLSKRLMEDQIKMLKFTVQKLEDEKKFLTNQVRSNPPKKRKLNETQQEDEIVVRPSVQKPQMVRPQADTTRFQADTALLTDYLWKLSILGSNKTVVEYLGKICLKNLMKVKDLVFKQDVPLSGMILEYLISKKDLRLDILVQEFISIFGRLVDDLMASKQILPVPFILVLLHGVLGFKPLAVNVDTITELTLRVINIIDQLKYNLNNEDDELFSTSKTELVLILEKYSVICCMDLVEKLVNLSSLYPDQRLSELLFDEIGIYNLISELLPLNTEAFMNKAQINVVSSIVGVFDSYYENNLDAELPKSKIKILVNINLNGIPIKEDFRVYGLNRSIGNNMDFELIDQAVFNEKLNLVHNPLAVIPQPISDKREKIHCQDDSHNHEVHLYDLRLRIAQFIENYIVNRMAVDIIKDIDIVKQIVRSINLEQRKIANFPRSNLMDQRIRLVSKFIVLLNYLFKEIKTLNEIIDVESLNELTIVLSRIAFSSSNLTSLSYNLVKFLRSNRYELPIFNETCEAKARDINDVHFNNFDNTEVIEAENDYPNGLEIPYDTETIELSREILGSVVDNDVADNLYINVYGDFESQMTN